MPDNRRVVTSQINKDLATLLHFAWVGAKQELGMLRASLFFCV